MKKFWSIALILITLGQNLRAQEPTSLNSATTKLTLGVTEVALLRLNAPLISLQLNQREAGLSIETSKSDSTARLYISSLISTEPRTLSARISDGTVPTGTLLQLMAQQPNANFVGSWGTLAPLVTLDNTSQIFVTNIASCYSGTETNDGYPLRFNYSLDPNTGSYGSIRASNGTSVEVTITLSSQ